MRESTRSTPLTRRLLHVDFYRIRDGQAARVKVPVSVKGEAKGIKQQGACSTSSTARSRSSVSRRTSPSTLRWTSPS